MDHSNHTPLSAAELTESNLVGAPIYGLDDRKVGSVSHLHDSGSTGKAVVDVGGFLGIGEKSVALSADMLRLAPDADGDGSVLRVSATEDQLKALPAHEG